jgi:hypothetical protein
VAVEDAYELAYREAVRALEHQRAEAAELRSRASLLLAASSISISLLSGRSASPLAWAATACFALLCLCVLAIVWPSADSNFNVDPQTLLRDHLSSITPSTVAMWTDLVAHLATHSRAGERRISRLSRTFRSGICLLAIQLVLTLTAATVTV